MATAARPLAAARSRRVVLVVVLAALAAAAALIGATLLQSRGETTTVQGAVVSPQPGNPPLRLNFGVDTSTEARALAGAQRLYDNNHVAQAEAIFRRYASPEARIGAAFAAWNQDGLATVEQLAKSYPSSGVVLLHLGLAQFWAGRDAAAVATWEKTARVAADSPYGVQAEDFLHPTLKLTGLPYLLLDVQPARAIQELPAAAQVAALAKAARKPNARAKLLYGLALWTNLERPISAERQFVAAARLAPHDPVARTAAAVGAFTKADPAKAFGRLGPLTGVFPKSAVVRLELGLLLLWNADPKKALTQLRLAAADQPGSSYSKNAKALLARLPGTRSK